MSPPLSEQRRLRGEWSQDYSFEAIESSLAGGYDNPIPEGLSESLDPNDGSQYMWNQAASEPQDFGDMDYSETIDLASQLQVPGSELFWNDDATEPYKSSMDTETSASPNLLSSQNNWDSGLSANLNRNDFKYAIDPAALVRPALTPSSVGQESTSTLSPDFAIQADSTKPSSYSSGFSDDLQYRRLQEDGQPRPVSYLPTFDEELQYRRLQEDSELAPSAPPRSPPVKTQAPTTNVVESQDAPNASQRKRSKQVAHSKVEKRYRANLNGKIDRLRDHFLAIKDRESAELAQPSNSSQGSVPTLSRDMSKGDVLSMTIVYLENIQGELGRLNGENAALKHRLDLFRSLASDEGDVPVSGHSAKVDTLLPVRR